ncbi:YdeI family protein [Paenibacillus sp. NPDC057967]|uniref:YdeI/OmpD-associated family protein n=1 Tax=Paenibacillus sp. NPDC057967 TaxID=3346293 RepID=UPI0036D8E59A
MNAELSRKLRLEPDKRAVILHPPDDYDIVRELGLPASSSRSTEDELGEGAYEFVLLFVTSLAELEKRAPVAIRAAETDALLWICYPKGTSRIKTDINRDTGWTLMKTFGTEGVAMISMDETWSAMRYRPEGAAKSSRSRKKGSELGALAVKPSAAVPDLPDDLKAAFTASPEARTFFDTLTDSMRRDYLNWILEAKREETRAKRVSASIEKLGKGLKRPTDK